MNWIILPVCLFFFVIGALVFFALFLAVITVEGGSMLPTFTEGDRVLVLRHWPDALLRKDQFVVFFPKHQSPSSIVSGPSDSHLLIKRVVALPGDPVVPNWLEGSKTPPTEIPSTKPKQEIPEIVPPGQVFVIGDASLPQHNPSGPEPTPWSFQSEDLYGVVIMRLAPKDE